MWIAKPLSALDPSDLEAWERTLQASRFRESDIPLAQTRGWARATETLGSRCWWIGSLEEPVGGLVYADPRQAGVLHCQNGPLLDWDRADRIPAQVALFAQAASRVVGRSFRSLSLRPRWREARLESRLATLPLEATSLEHAETRILSVAVSDTAQLATLSPRLRRSLRKALAHGTSLEWQVFDPKRDASWIQSFQHWGIRQSFFVPPAAWFESLSAHLPLYLATAESPECGSAGGLFGVHHGTGHFLFGAPQGLPQGPRRGDLLGGLVQFIALRNLSELRVTQLDLNGDLSDPPSGHPYRGVAEFKRQWGGDPVRFASPEFRIEA
jgi:hypothetical protein